MSRIEWDAAGEKKYEMASTEVFFIRRPPADLSRKGCRGMVCPM